MGTRPLRRYGAHTTTIEVADDLGDVVEPWTRHRLRFLEALAALDEEAWRTPSRCDGWDARGVALHLSSADMFFAVSLTSGAAGNPTDFLADFDPTSTPAAMVASEGDLSGAEVLERFRKGHDTLLAAVAAVDDWTAVAESPMGQVSSRLVLAHALWDSWLHERDVLEPIGQTVPVLDDELSAVTWYALTLAGLQGGLLDDPAPVGPGPDAPIDVTLCFDDLSDLALHVRYDTGVLIERTDPGSATPVGSARATVEAYTGRAPMPDPSPLPAALASQLGRANDVL